MMDIGDKALLLAIILFALFCSMLLMWGRV